MKRLLTLGLIAIGACTTACTAESTTENEASSSSDIVDVSPSITKEQSVPNCWLYAMASWTEAMHNGALAEGESHDALDLSESYWTYWHWFDQLTTRELAFSSAAPSPLTLEPTGNWQIATEIIARRGYMREADFLPSEDGALRSERQWRALRVINGSLLPGGPLATPAQRTPENVLDVLDKAFGLAPEMIAQLRSAFGPRGSLLFNRPAPDAATTTDAPGVHVASELAMRPGPNGEPLTLADLIGTSPKSPNPAVTIVNFPRGGKYAWQMRGSENGWDDASVGFNRGLVKMIQKTLHSRRPVYLFWSMDDHYLDASGAYQAQRNPSFTTDDPARHLAVITDYEVDNVPGFGLLPAGVDETRPEALAAALDDRATVKFFRINNPWWGSYAADGPKNPFAAAGARTKTGYNDVSLDYLNGSAFGWRRLRQIVLPPDVLFPAPPQP